MTYMGINMRTTQRTNEKGFALLLTLIVVAVTLAIGLSLLNITLKQFTLASTARDSEIAFHASDSALECLQARRKLLPSYYLDGTAVSAYCGGVTSPSTVTTASAGGGTVRKFAYEFSNFGAANVCVDASMYVLDMRSSSTGVTNYGISNEGLESLDCSEGVVCTVIFSRGYNRNCSDLDSIRAVQRELTVQF